VSAGRRSLCAIAKVASVAHRSSAEGCTGIKTIPAERRYPCFGFDIWRAVDDDEISLPRPVGDPLLGAPTRKGRKFEADRHLAEPPLAQSGPGGETPLRVDVEQRDPGTTPRPGDRELCGQCCLASTALALRYRDYLPHHRSAL
jgi:hypothetical protein